MARVPDLVTSWPRIILIVYSKHDVRSLVRDEGRALDDAGRSIEELRWCSQQMQSVIVVPSLIAITGIRLAG